MMDQTARDAKEKVMKYPEQYYVITALKQGIAKHRFLVKAKGPVEAKMKLIEEARDRNTLDVDEDDITLLKLSVSLYDESLNIIQMF